MDAGPFITNISEIDAELEMGMAISRDDISQREFLGLRMLREERDKALEARRRYEEASRRNTKPHPVD